jgi:membrane carboxypeptidase/penicillin-binding protein PbpC
LLVVIAAVAVHHMLCVYVCSPVQRRVCENRMSKRPLDESSHHNIESPPILLSSSTTTTSVTSGYSPPTLSHPITVPIHTTPTSTDTGLRVPTKATKVSNKASNESLKRTLTAEEKVAQQQQQQRRRDNQFAEIKETNRIVDINELDEDLFCELEWPPVDDNEDDQREELKDDPIEVSLWPRRVVNELNINGIPSRQQLFDRSFKRLPLLSTIHVW